jgi:hypothetical protein
MPLSCKAVCKNDLAITAITNFNIFANIFLFFFNKFTLDLTQLTKYSLKSVFLIFKNHRKVFGKHTFGYMVFSQQNKSAFSWFNKIGFNQNKLIFKKTKFDEVSSGKRQQMLFLT